MHKFQKIILKNAKKQLADMTKKIDKVLSLAELDKVYSCFRSAYDTYSLSCNDYNHELKGTDEFLKEMEAVLNEAWDLAKNKYNKRMKYYIQLN